jgi:hypothetical protein
MLAGLVMLLLLAVLPSALNLPQSNPSQTLEYAPVPPEDEITPPPAGNFASLGLGGSASMGSTDAGEGTLPGQFEPTVGRVVKTASTKRCVGSPPRQTEDPLSPPCVAVFTGDNGGATYLGVTADEVRVVLHFPGATSECYYTRPCEPIPANKTYDLGAPPADNEPTRVKLYRTWQRYFNERYQTYGRFVRLFVDFSNGCCSPEVRRSDAAEILKDIRPFAALEYLFGSSDAFVEAIVRRKAMSFGGRAMQLRAAYKRYPGLIWSFAPPAEYVAESFADFICTKAKPYPTSFSGNPGQNGTPRVFAFLHTNSNFDKRFLAMADIVKGKTENCGVRYAVDATYPQCPGLNLTANQDAAAAAVALMKSEGVTTVVQPGCWEDQLTRTANAANFYPEWLVADYRGFERSEVGQIGQDQNVWGRAWVITPQTLQNAQGGLPVEPPCLDAYLSVDPTIDKDSFEPTIACEVYNDLRMVFTGIQVAGPKLHPATVEKGFRAIPAKPSPGLCSPRATSCPGTTPA